MRWSHSGFAFLLGNHILLFGGHFFCHLRSGFFFGSRGGGLFCGIGWLSLGLLGLRYLSATNLQYLTAAHALAVEVIECHQFVHTHIVVFGNALNGFAAFHLVVFHIAAIVGSLRCIIRHVGAFFHLFSLRNRFFGRRRYLCHGSILI